jgi:hypothetical protein
MPGPGVAKQFLIRHPGWSTAVILTVGLLVAAIPYIGPYLSTALIAGGLGTVLLMTRTRSNRELPLDAPRAEISGGRPDQPVGHITRVLGSPAPQAPSSQDLTTIAARMPLDPRDRPLDEQVEVAGETHHTRAIRAVFRDVGGAITGKGSTLRDLQCTLIPEPWNQYDANAVAVLIGHHHVGYLPAELAEFYSGPLREIAQSGLLISGRARVWAKDDSGMTWARVTIAIPAVEDLYSEPSR